MLGLALCGVLGCRSPEIVETYDPPTDSVIVELGPFDVPRDVFGSIRFVARASGKLPPVRPAERVLIQFNHVSFKAVTFHGDGEPLHYRRSLFEEYGVVVEGEVFAELARSRSIRGHFVVDDIDFDLDIHPDSFYLGAEDMEMVRDFARRVHLLDENDRPIPRPKR